VDHFYLQKKNSKGSQRFIAKMHLNQLYGYFGRSLELLETINIHKKDLENYMFSYIIENIIEVNDEILVLLIKNNLDSDFIKKLNATLITNNKFKCNQTIVRSNVAIASAVTAYARITMIPYKLLPGTVYTDTDSIFTTDILSNHLVGKN
jgi:hypothetical protein